MGKSWKTCAAPWAKIMNNPQWPVDVQNSLPKQQKHSPNDTSDDSDDSDVEDQESMGDGDELDDATVALLLNEIKVEENEVEILLDIVNQ
jgi:hypothetical protein